MNLSVRARLMRLERVASPKRHLVLYQDVDAPSLFRDPSGAVYAEGGDEVIRDAGGGVTDADPLIVVRYEAKGRDSPDW